MTDKGQPADDGLKYLVWNLVDHYQNDHPDPDQTKECRFAIETIEELEVWADTRAREAEQRLFDSLIYAAGIDGKLTLADLQTISSKHFTELRTPEQEGTES